MIKPDNQDLSELTTILGYVFKKDELLRAALTHPSLNNGTKKKAGSSSPYERLEFLGDRVLGVVIAEWLYQAFPQSNEGDLAKRHAGLVNRDTIREIALEIGLARFLRLARGEDPLAGRKNLAALADAIEAVIGAMYLDGGLDVAKKFIRRYWDKPLHHDITPPTDTKTALQEWAQGKSLPLPVYNVIRCTGPSHAPKFVVEVVIEGFGSAQAEGQSKRLAEKAAAEILLQKA